MVNISIAAWHTDMWYMHIWWHILLLWVSCHMWTLEYCTCVHINLSKILGGGGTGGSKALVGWMWEGHLELILTKKITSQPIVGGIAPLKLLGTQALYPSTVNVHASSSNEISGKSLCWYSGFLPYPFSSVPPNPFESHPLSASQPHSLSEFYPRCKFKIYLWFFSGVFDCFWDVKYFWLAHWQTLT